VRKSTDNLSAWECLVRGMFLSARMSNDDSHAALDLLRQAIAHDPGYAQALGLIAWVMVWRAFQGWDDMQVALAEGGAISQRALAADDNEPWAWLGQAAIGMATRDSSLAVSSMERAVEINPNFAMGQGMLGLALSFSGRYAEALSRLGLAVRLSPRELFQGAFAQQYAFAHFAGADYASGLEFAMRAHQLRPGHVYPMVIGAACAGYLGSRPAAAQIIRDLKAVSPHATADWFETTAPYVLAEDRQRLATGLRLAGLD
jgi:adenylate cyclase